MIRIKGGGEPIDRLLYGKRNGAISIPRERMPSLKDYKAIVTKKPARSVTKSRKVRPLNTPEKGGDRRTGKVKAPSPPPAQEAKVGRPKTHATAADRQRAYRERQKEAKA